MTIDEHIRTGIHNWFVDAMGSELGDGLMTLLPPTGWADVATKQDLAQLEERLDLRFDMIDQRFEMAEYKILGALDRRLTDAMRATFFALAALLLTVTTIMVSVVLATR